jgi:23S rRNA (guanine745-N1)-methyltransferase
VRSCGRALQKSEPRWHCSGGHSFDLARSGYLNLLQPQDRRSAEPGDSKAAVAARRRLHDSGATIPIFAAMAEFLQAPAAMSFLDAGCGEGFFTAGLAAQGYAIGVDLAQPAIEAAARRYPAHTWIVGNADRSLPAADHSIDIGLSLTGRRPVREFARVLKPDAQLLVAIPAPEDLIEIRGAGRDRRPATLAEFHDQFNLDREQRITCTAHLEAAAIKDIRTAIYRPLHAAAQSSANITFSLDLLLLRPLPVR